MKTFFSFRSIRGKLNAMGFLVCSGLLLAGSIGILTTKATQGSLERAYHNRLVPLRLLKVMSESYSSIIPNTIARMNNGELTTAEGLSLIETSRDSIQRRWREYQNRPLSEAERVIVNDMKDEIDAADQEIEGMIRMLEIFLSQGKGLLSNQLSMVLNSLDPTVRPLSDKINRLTQIQMDLASQEYLGSQNRFNVTVFLLISIIFMLLAILFVAGIKMQKHIMSQLQLTLPALGEIGRGDLRIHIDTHIPDEFSDIAHGINHMTHSLRTLVGRIAHSSSHLAECAMQFNNLSGNIALSSRTNATNSNLTSMATSEASLTLSEISRNLSGIGRTVEQLVAQMEHARQGVHHANQIGKDGLLQAAQAATDIIQAEQSLQKAFRYAADLSAMWQIFTNAIPGQDQLRLRMDEFLLGLSEALQNIHSLNIHQTTLTENSKKISDSIQGVHEVFNDAYQILQTLHISTHGTARDIQESSKALTQIAATAEQAKTSALDSAKEILQIQEKARELKVLSQELGKCARKFRLAE